MGNCLQCAKEMEISISFFLGFLRQGFALVLEPVLELALVDQAVLKLTDIRPSLPPECWD